jgi:hypothetical protein
MFMERQTQLYFFTDLPLLSVFPDKFFDKVVLKHETANLFNTLSNFTFTVALTKDAAVYMLLRETSSHQLDCVSEGKPTAFQCIRWYLAQRVGLWEVITVNWTKPRCTFLWDK